MMRHNGAPMSRRRSRTKRRRRHDDERQGGSQASCCEDPCAICARLVQLVPAVTVHAWSVENRATRRRMLAGVGNGAPNACRGDLCAAPNALAGVGKGEEGRGTNGQRERAGGLSRNGDKLRPDNLLIAGLRTHESMLPARIRLDIAVASSRRTGEAASDLLLTDALGTM